MTQQLVTRSPMAEQLDREAWLAKRLGDHGVAEIFAGLTDPAVRRERVREVILARGLECVIVGRHEGKPCTYAEIFQVIFGVPL